MLFTFFRGLESTHLIQRRNFTHLLVGLMLPRTLKAGIVRGSNLIIRVILIVIYIYIYDGKEKEKENIK